MSNAINDSHFITVIHLQKVTDTESTVSVNDKRTDKTILVMKFHRIKIQQK